MKDVAGKAAFITGGSSGIGLGIARAFKAAGMNIIIGYRTQKHLEEAMSHLTGTGSLVHAICVDVTDRSDMERAAREAVRIFGKVHILVNNAGVGSGVSLCSATYDDWDWMMGVNLNGVFNGVHAFLPHLRAHNEGGQIVTTASVFGLIVSETMSVYSTSKFAVVGMMEALRAELADTNIGVSVFCPGIVTSNFIDSDRNRPKGLSDSHFKQDPQLVAQAREAMKSGATPGMDSLEAGQLLLRGIRNNDLYILSHPEFERGIRDRNEALIASIPTDLRAPEARVAAENLILRNPIYSVERDRILRAQASIKCGTENIDT